MKGHATTGTEAFAKGADEGVPTQAARNADERALCGSGAAGSGRIRKRCMNCISNVCMAFVASRVRDRATAEDVTSEVFHKGLANLPSYEWRGVPFAAWLLRIGG